MTFLPIVERELRVSARTPRIFRLRIVVAVVTCIIAAVMLVLGGNSSSGQAGRGLFTFLSTIAFLYCLFEGARHAADSLSQEKREGTLGLLFLTDLRGYDVVLGKLAAFSVKSWQGLFAFLPVLSVALLLGGTTVGEFWRVALVLFSTLLLSLSLGLGVSAVSRESHKALIGTICVIAAITAVPFMLSWIASMAPALPRSILGGLSPAYAGYYASDVLYRADPSRFWISLSVVNAVSLFALVGASFAVPNAWQDQPSDSAQFQQEQRRLRRRFGNEGKRAELRARLLDINPIFWLAARQQGERAWIWCLISIGAVASISVLLLIRVVSVEISLALSSAVLFVLSLALKVWVAAHASMTLAKARQNGAIELMLATPLTLDEIIRGQWLALRSFFLRPMIAFFVLKGLTIAAGFTRANGQPAWAFFPPVGMAIFETITFGLDVVAIAWVGMLMAMSQKGPNRACFNTLLYGFVLPAIIVCVPNVFIDLILINWSKQKLTKQFRKLAAERFDQPGQKTRVVQPPILREPIPPVVLGS